MSGKRASLNGKGKAVLEGKVLKDPSNEMDLLTKMKRLQQLLNEFQKLATPEEMKSQLKDLKKH